MIKSWRQSITELHILIRCQQLSLMNQLWECHNQGSKQEGDPGIQEWLKIYYHYKFVKAVKVLVLSDYDSHEQSFHIINIFKSLSTVPFEFLWAVVPTPLHQYLNADLNKLKFWYLEAFIRGEPHTLNEAEHNLLAKVVVHVIFIAFFKSMLATIRIFCYWRKKLQYFTSVMLDYHYNQKFHDWPNH